VWFEFALIGRNDSPETADAVTAKHTAIAAIYGWHATLCLDQIGTSSYLSFPCPRNLIQAKQGQY
jgi:hypothetical protein